MEERKTPFGGKLLFYPAGEKSCGETVLICPGGGYNHLAPREAEPVARVFNENGYDAAVLMYSLEGEVLGKEPVRELGWSVRFLRTDVSWKGKAKKLWVAGFSAGCHLAASRGALWNEDSVFEESVQLLSRPDGVILGYPVISMRDAYAHPRSVKELTGGDEELKALFSLEERDLSQMPPVFIWNTLLDEKVPALNSILFVEKLAQDGASCEYHLFHKGLHGMSLATPEVTSDKEGLYPDSHIARWMELCLEWMKEN